MDTYEARLKSIKAFQKDEYNFWQLVKNIHNKWSASNLIKAPLLEDSWEVFTTFDKPLPIIDRDKEVDTAIKEKDSGVISQETMIRKLYPKWDDKRVMEEIEKINREAFNGLDAN